MVLTARQTKFGSSIPPRWVGTPPIMVPHPTQTGNGPPCSLQFQLRFSWLQPVLVQPDLVTQLLDDFRVFFRQIVLL